MESAKPTFGSKYPPPFLHHTTLSRNTQVGFKHTNLPIKLPVPHEPSKKKKFPLNVLVQNLRKEVLKREGNIISMKGF